MGSLQLVEQEAVLQRSATYVIPIWHSEEERCYNLVSFDAGSSDTPFVPSEKRLKQGVYRHYKGGHYFLNRLVCLGDEVGVWYIALGYTEGNTMGPHWYRPLYSDDGAGWLNLVNGKLRFEIVRFDRYLPNQVVRPRIVC